MPFRRKPDTANLFPESIIHATDVTKTYDTGKETLAALRAVHFSVAPGEMVAVMGPSGCGKTTLLNCLSGLDEIDSGRIWLAGKELTTMSDKQRTKYRAEKMGFVFQAFNLLPVLSAVENVELPLLLSGMKPSEARDRGRRALDQVGLGQWSAHRPAELSGGQRQRVTIARALVNNPAIVWADEPTGALDSRSADDIVDLLRTLNEEHGLTLVLVTHDQTVGRRCDRIVNMLDGQIASDHHRLNVIEAFERSETRREALAV